MNSICLTGKIKKPYLDHEAFGEKFYKSYISVERLSGRIDLLPLIISEKLLTSDLNDISECRVKIMGDLRSHNDISGGKSRLILYVFVSSFDFIEESTEDADINEVSIEGFICKKPTYRVTPYGRKISDLLVAVNRSCGKSCYIPCICWGRNATYASGFSEGEKIKLTGRFQSRVYYKKIDDFYTNNSFLKKTAYEVSVSSVEVVENENNN